MTAIPQGGEYFFCTTQGGPLNDIAIFFSSSLCKSLSLGDYLPVTQMVTPEVEFVHPVSPGRSVKFVASGVNFSIFTNCLCFFLLKLLKLGEIDGVKFLTLKSGGVNFWTNSMSGNMRMKTIHTF